MNNAPGSFSRRNVLRGAAATAAVALNPKIAKGQTKDTNESPNNVIETHKKEVGELLTKKINSASTVDPASPHRDPVEMLLLQIAFAKKSAASLIQMKRVEILLKGASEPADLVGKLKSSVTATQEEVLENPGRYMWTFIDLAKSLSHELRIARLTAKPGDTTEFNLTNIELELTTLAVQWNKQILKVEREYERDATRLAEDLKPGEKYWALPPAEQEKDMVEKIKTLRERGQEEILSYIQKL